MKWPKLLGVRVWQEPDGTVAVVLSVEGRTNAVNLAIRPEPRDYVLFALLDRFAGTELIASAAAG